MFQQYSLGLMCINRHMLHATCYMQLQVTRVYETILNGIAGKQE